MNNKIEIDFTPLANALDTFTITAEEAAKSFLRLNATVTIGWLMKESEEE